MTSGSEGSSKSSMACPLEDMTSELVEYRRWIYPLSRPGKEVYRTCPMCGGWIKEVIKVQRPVLVSNDELMSLRAEVQKKRSRFSTESIRECARALGHKITTSAPTVSLERYWQERNVYDLNQYEIIVSEMRRMMKKLKQLSDDRNQMLLKSRYINCCIQNAINNAKIARNQRKRTGLMLKLEALFEKRYLGKRASPSQTNQTKAEDRKKTLSSNKIFDKIEQHIEKKKSLSQLAGCASNFDSGWNFSGIRRVYISYNHSCLCGGEFPTIPCVFISNSARGPPIHVPSDAPTTAERVTVEVELPGMYLMWMRTMTL